MLNHVRLRCNICYHSATCTCDDYCIYFIICSHIHAFFTLNPDKFEQDIIPETNSPIEHLTTIPDNLYCDEDQIMNYSITENIPENSNTITLLIILIIKKSKMNTKNIGFIIRTPAYIKGAFFD